MRRPQICLPRLFALATLAFVPIAAAEASSLSTVFGPNSPPGAQPTAANGAISPELEAITQFGGANTGTTVEEFDGTTNLGSIAFVQNGPYYVEGNRAYGFAGTGRSDITFTPGLVTAVELEVRGSVSTDQSGPNSFTVPGSTFFDDSNVSLLIWSEIGVQSVTQNISNTGFQTVSLDVGALSFLGDSITRISLINGTESAPVGANSLALIGRLSVTAIPEPTGLLLAMGPLATMLAGRRRRR